MPPGETNGLKGARALHYERLLEVEQPLKKILWGVALAGSIVGVWAFACAREWAPSYLLPSPLDVLAVLRDDAGVLARQGAVTAVEWTLGLALSVIIGLALCAACYASRSVTRVVRPLLVVSQAVPYLSFAPLLLLWLGLGLAPKVALVVLTCVFPIAFVWLDDLLRARNEYAPVCAMLKMSPARAFLSVSLPASLPGFFAGLKVSVSYAVVGAVLSELIGAEAGIGVYMTRAQSAYRIDRVVAAVLVIVAASLISAGVVEIVRRRVVFWEARRRV